MLIETRNKPEGLPVAIKVDESHYECDTSKSYLQRSIRVYYKQLDDDGVVSKHLKGCFNALVERMKSECIQQSHDDTGSLSGSVVEFSATNVNVCTQSPIKEESPIPKRRKRDNGKTTLFNSAIGRIENR